MPHTTLKPRNTDSKGRLTLGPQFANRTVLMERRGDELVIRLARVIPDEENHPRPQVSFVVNTPEAD